VHVESYYDEYVPRQTATGVNARHKSIARLLISFGLQPDHRVLEIGCGIGTVTGLVAEKLSAGGSLLATDLSPKSIEAAKRRLAGFGNVRLLAGDILSLDLNDIFDVVVLPDVIEHIPIESHPALFGRVAGWLKPEGFAFLHYPNPFYLEWLHEHRPELLQIVDQPIHADILLANASPQGLYLEHYETYFDLDSRGRLCIRGATSLGRSRWLHGPSKAASFSAASLRQAGQALAARD
jgi:SAM-dependent methyltransferase